MKAKVDPKVCQAHGVCEGLCPEVFKVVGEKSEVQVDDVPQEAEDSCRKAAGGCPTGAISIEE